MRRTARAVAAACLIAVPALSWVACQARMTYREALAAMAESARSGKGEALTREIIEISTDFTIGEAVETAAAELAAWLESQIECSTVSLDGATVTVDFGVLGDACTYNGHTYAGVWEITVVGNQGDGVHVEHVWDALTNGDVTLDGVQDVYWTDGATSRQVVTDITWSDDDGAVDVTGDRTQQLIDAAAGIAEGIVVDGSREWTVPDGTWSLAIEGVEMRGQDPVPQAGSYTLTTPELKTCGIAFARVDDDTIECVLSAGTRSWTFHVSSSGEVDEGA